MLLPDKFYHIYNHANGDDNLFTKDENYYFFLQKLIKYVIPTGDVYAYCLLPNHFHLLARIKNRTEVKEYYENYLKTNNIFFEEELEIQKILLRISSFDIIPESTFQYQKYISKQFSNLFSSYTQAFNKLYNRKGSLFLKNFKSKEITSDKYLAAIIHYIHINPVHHGLVAKLEQWKWSSYHTFLSDVISHLQKDKVLSWFGTIEEFISAHRITSQNGLAEQFD